MTRLIDEVKKLRDECKNEEEYYNERFDLWMRYKGKSWPELTSDAAACQSVGAIRSELDRIISDYKPEPVKHAHWIEGNEDHVSCDSVCYYTCSECKHSFSDDTPYCPHCGAKMDEEMENKS